MNVPNPDEMPIEGGLNPGDAEAIAQLLGATASQLKKVDSETVTTSSTFKGLQLNPKEILQRTLKGVRRPASPPQVYHPAPVEQVHFQPAPVPEQVISMPPTTQTFPPQIQVAPSQMAQVVIMDTKTVQEFRDEITALNERMDALIDHVALLHSLEEKFMEMMDRRLKKGISSFTIKLNEPPVKKQKELHQQLSGTDQQAQ